MRVLLDESIPRRLKNELTGHEVATVREQGWCSKENGELLALAFVGAGASAPLYPLWGELIRSLADAAVTTGKATAQERDCWCRQAGADPLETARSIRSRLGAGRYAERVDDYRYH